MSRSITIALIVLTVMLLSHCSNNRITGNNEIKTEFRPLKPFDVIHTDGKFRIMIESNRLQAVRVKADSNILPFIQTTVQNNMLDIAVKDNVKLKTKMTPIIKINVENIRALQVAKGSVIDATNINSQHLKIEAANHSRMHLSGYTQQLNVTLIGSAYLNARELVANKVVIDAYDFSEAVLHVAHQLKVNIDDAAVVKYYGDPIIEKQTTGVTQLIPAKENY